MKQEILQVFVYISQSKVSKKIFLVSVQKHQYCIVTSIENIFQTLSISTYKNLSRNVKNRPLRCLIVLSHYTWWWLIIVAFYPNYVCDLIYKLQLKQSRRNRRRHWPKADLCTCSLQFMLLLWPHSFSRNIIWHSEL